MKAIVFEKYGSPDVLQLKEFEKPTPQDDQVLVKIHAASANPLDWHRMRGAPVLVRLDEGLSKPKNPRLGADVAGQVEAVGKNVTQFKVGDEVYGEISSGGFAEYACVHAQKLCLKPANLSFAEVAAVPVAALTALQSLRNKVQIEAGQQVLINGASGGVGIFTVQLAKYFGAEVTAVCSPRNIDLVRKLGADHIIDYTQAQVIDKNSPRYDLIIDNVGNLSASDYRRGLKPQGRGVIVGFTTLPHMISTLLQGVIMGITRSKKVGTILAQTNQEDLTFLKEILESGQVVPVIDKCYPLEETAEAIRYLETSRARGKVIITVE